MTRTISRFAPRWLATAALAAPMGALAALAQSAAPTSISAAQITNIETSEAGDRLQVLVTFDQQPKSATARIEQNQLVVDLDGLTLAPLSFAPPADTPVQKVAIAPTGAQSSRITLTAQGLGSPGATLYRKAVLVELSRSAPAAVAPASDAPALAGGPVQLAAKASLAPASCDAAKATLAKNSWDIPALGEHALCLARDGKVEEAKNRLDQLAAFDPDDPRLAIGRKLVARSGPAAKPSAAAAPQAPAQSKAEAAH